MRNSGRFNFLKPANHDHLQQRNCIEDLAARPHVDIGVGRFRILGGPRGGPNSQQAHDVVTTSMRRNDVTSTSFRRRVPTRFLINQCQIITFLILKYDIIENSRIELRGIVLPVQVGGLLGGGGGGGGKGYVGPPPLKLLGGGLAPPLPTPMVEQ